MSLEYAN
jgi:tetratricopeptide (TPR) repeat protein